MKSEFKITFTVKNMPDTMLSEVAAMPANQAFNTLRLWANGDLRHLVSMKVGTSDAFRDRVALNHVWKAGKPFDTFKIEPRRGYRLATFTVQA